MKFSLLKDSTCLVLVVSSGVRVLLCYPDNISTTHKAMWALCKLWPKELLPNHCAFCPIEELTCIQRVGRCENVSRLFVLEVSHHRCCIVTSMVKNMTTLINAQLTNYLDTHFHICLLQHWWYVQVRHSRVHMYQLVFLLAEWVRKYNVTAGTKKKINKYTFNYRGINSWM